MSKYYETNVSHDLDVPDFLKNKPIRPMYGVEFPPYAASDKRLPSLGSETLRKRRNARLVLTVIKKGARTTTDIHAQLPHLSYEDIALAVHHLIQTNRINVVIIRDDINKEKK